jgi:hypothetical protein
VRLNSASLSQDVMLAVVSREAEGSVGSLTSAGGRGTLRAGSENGVEPADASAKPPAGFCAIAAGRDGGSGIFASAAGLVATAATRLSAAGLESSSSSSSVEKPNSLASTLPFFGFAAAARRSSSSPIAPELRAAASDMPDGAEVPRFSMSASASA